MLFTYLKELRKRPESVRKKHALILTFIVTAGVVAIYFFSIYMHTLGTRTPNDKGEETHNIETTTKALFNESNTFLGDIDTQQEQEEARHPAIQQDWSGNRNKIESEFSTIPVPNDSESDSQTEDSSTTTPSFF